MPLDRNFIGYLKEDGIILPPDENDNSTQQDPWDDHDSGIFSGTDADNELDNEDDNDPSVNWRQTHEAIKQTIQDLGGKVAPKMNWSAPKDATWINPTNSMECRSANDVYMMLKSSDFVTFDLEQVFDDTVGDGAEQGQASEVPYHLVLRKFVNVNPSVEFRCFVRRRRLLGICQRDLNHYDFLFKMQDDLRDVIQKFFDGKLKGTFPDESFVFDVYIPAPHEKVWLIDINPWAPRTDPILFSWLELLTIPDPPPSDDALSGGFLRLQMGSGNQVEQQASEDSDIGSDDDMEGVNGAPEMRLIGKDDPEARNFHSQQYSAHKMPKDVVDASQAGPGTMREFADQWKQVMQKHAQTADDSDADD